MATLQIYVTKIERQHIKECYIIDGCVTVIFDNEDEAVVNSHKWTMTRYGVKTTIKGEEVPLAQVIMCSYTKEQQTEMCKRAGRQFLWELYSPNPEWRQINTSGKAFFDHRKKNICLASHFHFK